MSSWVYLYILCHSSICGRILSVTSEMKPSEASGTDADFRVTFDENILFRDHDIALSADVYGTPRMEDGKVLMELKCSGGIPLWMVHVLSSEHIYKTSFSKYGTAYTRYISKGPKLPA